MRRYGKRRLLLVVAVLSASTMFTGCGVNLTDEQNRLIAEYAADLLLDYDADYQQKYGSTEENTEEVSQVTEDVTTEEVTEVTTEEPTTAVTVEDDTELPTEDEGTTEDMQSSEESSVPPVSVSNVSDIAEIIGIPDLSITYNKCMFLDRYPAVDQDGVFIYLEADEGCKLAILKFNIVNSGSEPITLDMLNTDIKYQLLMNDTKAAKPMLTILMDDLVTYSNPIPPDTEQSAVLVFQISDKSISQIENLDLKVIYSDTEHLIHIQ